MNDSAKGLTAATGRQIAAALLDWYDVAARDLPWRIGPHVGRAPDPYHVWLSEIMLQQTTVAAVRDYFIRFTTRWPKLADLAAAEDAEVMAAWAGLGYYARARNLLRCARAVAQRPDGAFPQDEDALRDLPGVGPYTAAAIAAIAFGRRATVVDGNVERVVARLACVTEPLPAARPELRRLAAHLAQDERPGDLAQAMMDLGATVCTPRSPDCGACPVRRFCAALAAGIAADLPGRAARVPRPELRGIAYVVRRADGAVLLERRPERGILGGMMGWPTSAWTPGEPEADPPADLDWTPAPQQVRHVFTHFALTLSVMSGRAPAGLNPRRGQFVAAGDFRRDALPTLMRKVLDVTS